MDRAAKNPHQPNAYYQQCAIPKGRTKRQVKARKDREDAKQLKKFRDAVWKREEEVFLGFEVSEKAGESTWACCQWCAAIVTRDKDWPLSGEVHHRIYRGNKATRYDPANGVLLCNHLVNNCHQLAELGRITV